jgi:hypothetical protein
VDGEVSINQQNEPVTMENAYANKTRQRPCDRQTIQNSKKRKLEIMHCSGFFFNYLVYVVYQRPNIPFLVM